MRGYVVQQWARDTDGHEYRVADDKTVPSLGHAEAVAERYRADAGITVRIVRESTWEAFVRGLGIVLSAVWNRFLYPAISVVVLVFWAVFAWYTAWDLIGFARKSPGMFIAGLLAEAGSPTSGLRPESPPT